MVCQICGGAIGAGAQYCSACGTRVSTVAPAYRTPMVAIAAPRVRRNVQTLGVLWCVYGVYRLAIGLIGTFFLQAVAFRHFGGGWPFWGQSHFMGPVWPSALVHLVMGLTILSTALALLTGFALLTRQPWGRTLAIVVGILSLIRLPLGTALGIYTLWVLAPAVSGAEYEEIAAQG
jgi:hypothetical protein